MTTDNHNHASDLRAQATVLEIPVAVKEIIEDFLLITYDIPTTEEGNKARYEFLTDSRTIGAVQHSESVYLMPWTDEANALVLNLSAKGGKVYAWYAKTDKDTARELTRYYDSHVKRWLDDLDERLDRMELHILNQRFKLAGRMMQRTVETFSELEGIIRRRGSPVLLGHLDRLRREMAKIMAKV